MSEKASRTFFFLSLLRAMLLEWLSHPWRRRA